MEKNKITEILENTTATDSTSPTLSFKDYIETLKQFADTAGACAICNEFITSDGYTISIRIEKTKE